MALQANMNRDPKKQRKPFGAEDFCCFIDQASNKPEREAATAFMALVRDKVLPAWALGFFADFKNGEPTKRPSDELAMVGNDVILLAPIEIHEGFEGTIIAEQTASDQVRHLEHSGRTWVCKIPKFDGYLYAEAGVTVDIISQPIPLAQE